MSSTDWKHDPNLLAKKILARIESADGEVSYTDLEVIATTKQIDLNVFDAALSRLHRHKKVARRVSGDEIFYKPVPRETVKAINSHVVWLRENYPRPTPCAAGGCYGLCNDCIPFPDIDMSYITLRPDEMLEFKAKQKGMPAHIMKQLKKFKWCKPK